jgi:hypothetical protein
MTQPPTTDDPAREPEDSMSRLMQGPSGPLAWAGFIIGLLSMVLFLYYVSPEGFLPRQANPELPPSLLAVNLSFCALFMGVAALYRVRRRTRQTMTRSLALVTVLLGLVGPGLYSWQTLQWRTAVQAHEIDNVQRILSAVQEYVSKHDGQYPPDMLTLTAPRNAGGGGGGGLFLNYLSSPYTGRRPTPSTGADVSKRTVEMMLQERREAVANSDYEYLGAGLTEKMFTGEHALSKKTLALVFAKEARMRAFLTVGFADGSVKLLGPEEVAQTLESNNAARKLAGLPPLAPAGTATAPAATLP